MSIHKTRRIWPKISVQKQKSSPLRTHAAIRITAQQKALSLSTDADCQPVVHEEQGKLEHSTLDPSATENISA